MLHYLASHNIYVSSGSACSKKNKSYVLKNIGLNTNEIDSSIRVSFSKYNAKDEVDSLIKTIKSGIKNLAKRG